MNFEFSIGNFIRNFVGKTLLKTRLGYFVLAFLRPMIILHDEFLAYVDESRETLQYTGKVISLRNLLISRFGAGVIIELQEPVGNLNLLVASGDAFNPMLGGTGDLLNTQVGSSGTADLDEVDFIVKVPVALGADLNEVKGLINQYKVAGVTFKVEEI